MVENFDRFFDEVYDLFRDSRGWMLFPETRQVLEELRRQPIETGSNFELRFAALLGSEGSRHPLFL